MRSLNARLDARFNTIVIAESGGNARYDALVLQLNRRLSRGFQFSVNYTLSRGINDAADGELPDFRARNQSTAQESRQFQLGLKFIF